VQFLHILKGTKALLFQNSKAFSKQGVGDLCWILADGKWRDNGVWVDNGRWLDE
jgi:hypothetical protein